MVSFIKNYKILLSEYSFESLFNKIHRILSEYSFESRVFNYKILLSEYSHESLFHKIHRILGEHSSESFTRIYISKVFNSKMDEHYSESFAFKFCLFLSPYGTMVTIGNGYNGRIPNLKVMIREYSSMRI
jgi:hypothetical protein